MNTLMIRRRPVALRRVDPFARSAIFRDPFFADPFGATLARDMERMLDVLRADVARWPAPPRPEPVAPVQLDTTDEAVVVTVGLSGFEPGDVEVTVDDGVLVVPGDTARTTTVHDATAEEADQADTDGETLTPKVQRSFRRAWRLDADQFELDGIAAKYADDGSLQITVPRRARPEPRRIPIG